MQVITGDKQDNLKNLNTILLARNASTIITCVLLLLLIHLM